MAKDINSNPAALVWPSDPAGFLNKLKPELTRAAGRINGKPAKLEAYLATLRMAASHAKARYKNQKAANDAMIAKAREALVFDEVVAETPVAE